jgi:hypothetical protein
VEDVSSAAIEGDLARLEASIRQLKVQYDMFFAGALQRQPFELRAQCEQLVRRYSNAPIRKYAHRFHFNALMSRYNSLSEFWTKTLRAIEEGDRPAPALLDRHGAGERIITSCRVHDPSREQESIKILHDCFVEARRKVGIHDSTVPFESFLQGVTRQADRLRESSGCDEVELRLVVENRKVHLKARPSR